MLGKIVGKSSTNEFTFLAEKEARKFSYVQAKHQEGYEVLAQVVEVEKLNHETKAKCNILGYRIDKLLQGLKIPIEPNTDVRDADDMFIQNTLGLGPSKYGAYLGTLEGRRNIKVFLDLNKLLTKHVAVLAKSGSGKSYCVGVVLEEIMERNVPIVVIDPHGEYSTLKLPNPESKDELIEFGIKAKGYDKQLLEFSPDVKKNPTAKPLKLSSKNLTPDELMKLLPTKLSGAQMGVLYSAIKDLGGNLDFDTLIRSLEAEEGNAKWNLINVIYYLKQLDIFSDIPTSVHDLVIPAKCSVINLRGIPPNVQEVIVYKIVNDLFSARKHGEIPPFFLVTEECHNFCPERSFGEAKSSQILRNVASVDYFEKILVKKGSNVMFCSIGEFVDEIIEKNNVIRNKMGFEIVHLKSGYAVPAFNSQLKIEYKPIRKVIRHKIHEPLYELTLEKGRKVRITSSHSVFVFRKGKIEDIATSSIKKGDYVLVPLKIPSIDHEFFIDFRHDQRGRSFRLPEKMLLTKELALLFGYFVAEGSCRKTGIAFTLNIGERVYRDEICCLLKKIFEIEPFICERPEFSKVDIILHKTSLAELFSELCGQKAFDKKVPDSIFNGSDEIKAAFIRGCFNGDGYLRTRKGNKGGNHIEISYKTISKLLINSLSYLLLSLNICSSIYEIKPTRKGVHIAYQLVVSGRSCSLLLDLLGNNKHFFEIKESLKLKYRNTFLLEDLIPTEVFRNLYRQCKPIACDSSIDERMCIRRERANRKSLLKFLDYCEKKSRVKPDEDIVKFLRLLCNSDIGFLRVKDKRKIFSSSPFVYDLSIGESENFIAGSGGIILHNSEGRKFGLGLCAVTQRPARLDKNVLAQCTTQIILKLTNPNDLKMVSNSVEGITAETEREIRNINIGTAMIVGVVDMPLFVDVRPRKTKHGGEAMNILETFSDIGKDTKTDVLNIIVPKYTEVEIKKLITKPIKTFKTILVPCSLVACNKHGLQFSLLVNLTSAEVVMDFERGTGKSLIQNLGGLSQAEEKVLKVGLDLNREFNAADIFGKSGLQFSEVYDVLNSLAKKNYFIKNNEKYKVSNALEFYMNLDKMACFEKCEYKGIKFDEKVDAKYDIKEITTFLKKFFDVEGMKQTWLVKYDVEFSPLIP